ncbi:hypothetical protein, partial [Nocardia cyriacigeorgica]|uniref:hypothetical protein n=1 Tax=Nocardia cyriacigeorgica TaxID=135487 RepID=UPI001C49AA6B
QSPHAPQTQRQGHGDGCADPAHGRPPEPESPLTQYMKMLPPAPAWCAGVWDPIEDRIEDMVPPQAKDAFDAFDDWCEGEAD